MTDGSILFRADAGPEIGVGHVMRCLALAQAWRARYGASSRVAFASVRLSNALAGWLERSAIEVVALDVRPGSDDDARQTVRAATQRKAAWVVVDGLHFGFAFQNLIRSAGRKLLAVDDLVTDNRFDADLLLNSNLLIQPSQYAGRAGDARLLLGPQYVLLRQEFLRAGAATRAFPEKAGRILITIGGSDPDGLGIRLLKALANSAMDIRLVLGPSNPRRADTESTVRQCFPRDSSARGMLVDPTDDMPAQIAWADEAVILAGGTLWEMLFLGCPVLSYARNDVQSQILKQFDREGMAIDLGPVSGFDAHRFASAVGSVSESRERRRAMSVKGRELVDGKGGRRVVDAMGEKEAA